MCAKKTKSPLVVEFERVLKSCSKEQDVAVFVEGKNEGEKKEIGAAFMEYLRTDGNCAWGWMVLKEFRKRGWLQAAKETWELNAVLSHLAFAVSGRFDPETAIADFLCDESRFLEEEIWLIFEQPHRNLYRFNSEETGMFKKPWFLTFVTLVERGRLDRDRLINGLLKVFGYGYPEFDTRWFVKLLQGIKPTVGEIKSHEQEICQCLANSYSNVSGVALDLLQTLDKKDMLDDDAFLNRCESVLYDKSKPKVRKAVSILDKIAKRNPALRERVAPLLLKTMKHEAAEVQTAAIHSLLKYSDMLTDSVRTEIEQIVSLLAPSVKSQLPGFVQDVQEMKERTLISEKKKIDRLCKSRRLHPIQIHAELIDLGLKLLENSDDADEIELMYDGVLHLLHFYPKDFDRLVAPLNKRFETFFPHVNPGNGEFPHHVDYRTEIFAVLRYWVYLFDPKRDTGHSSFRQHAFQAAIQHWEAIASKEGPNLYALLLERNNAIFRRAGQVHEELKKPCQLLSTPTHQGGLIDPVLFVERLKDILNDLSVWDFYDESDKVLAFCRIAEEKRQDALFQLGEFIKDISPIQNDNLVEFLEALKYLLGTDVSESNRESMSVSHLWDAAKNNREGTKTERYRIESKRGDRCASLHLDSATHANGMIDPRIFVRRAVHRRKKGDSLFESRLSPIWIILNNLLALDHRDEAVEILDDLITKEGLEADDEIRMIRYALHGQKTLSGGLRGILKDALAPRDPELPPGLSDQNYWQLKGMAEISNWARKEIGKPHTLKDKRFIRDAAPLPTPWEVWLVPTFQDEAKPDREKAYLYPYRNTKRLAFKVQYIGENLGLQRWIASIFPNDPSLLLSAVFHIYFDMEKERDACKDIAFPGFLQLVLENDKPLDDIAATVLLMGMNSTNQSVAMLDVDIMITTIANGRLDADRLSKAIRLFLETGNLKPSRFAKHLSEVAKQSPVHGEVLRQAIDRGLFGEVNSNISPLLEVFLELCIDAKRPVESPECREMLASLKGSGKTAKLAKKLLEL